MSSDNGGTTEADRKVSTMASGIFFDLSIRPGWNLISIPLVDHSYKASSLDLEKYDVVASFNTTTQIYDEIFIVGVSPLGRDFALKESHGYWIHAATSHVLHLYGFAPKTLQTRAVTLPERGGWVNLGLCTLNTTWKASKIPTMFSGGRVATVASYNPDTKTYRTYVSGVPPSDFTLIPGQAYEVYCTGSGVFSYYPVSTPAASFTYAGVGSTVNVDASGSTAEAGIVGYEWDWGDGTEPTTTDSPSAAHVYGVPSGTVPAPPPSGPPWIPFVVFGYVKDSDGNPVQCDVTVTIKRSGMYMTVQSDPADGYYGVDIGYWIGWVTGDVVEVTAVKEDSFGSSWGTLSWDSMYLWLDVAIEGQATRTITLTVTDALSHTATTSHEVMVPHQPVVALFSYDLDGSTVYVEACDSTADAGIDSLTWDWGDGSAPEVSAERTASHTFTYDLDALITSSPALDNEGRPVPRFDQILGYTYDGDGTTLTGCSVTVTNTRTGEAIETVSDDTGYYGVVVFGSAIGDIIQVKSARGVLFGESSGYISDSVNFLWLDLTLIGPTITLTVTDTLGGTNSTSIEVKLQGEPTASFTVSPPSGYQTTSFTFDASGSWDDVTPTSGLRARWDWTGDGSWDTIWSTSLQASCVFAQSGTYQVRLEIMDTNGLVGSTTMGVQVDYFSPSWIGMTLDVPGVAGVGCSIAVDSNDKIHVSYQDFPSNDLKYATNADGSWKYYVLDSISHVGPYTSLALDSNNKVHISYLDGGNNGLMYITNAGGSWIRSTLDSSGVLGWYNSIAVDSKNRIHISYYDTNNNDLKYATNVGGSWAYYTLDSLGDVGEYTSIAVDSRDRVHISYLDHTNGDLKYATNSGGTWANYTLDSIGSVGSYTSIAVDSKNNVHISYLDDTGDDLKYATNRGGPWTIAALDNQGYVGIRSSIAVDSGDHVHICYYDASNTGLKYATNVGGYWACQMLDSLGRAGDWSSIAIDSNDKAHVCYYSDASWGIKYAYEA